MPARDEREKNEASKSKAGVERGKCVSLLVVVVCISGSCGWRSQRLVAKEGMDDGCRGMCVVRVGLVHVDTMTLCQVRQKHLINHPIQSAFACGGPHP